MATRKRQIGPVGTATRVLVGLGLLYLAGGASVASWGVLWYDPLVGFVALPALAVALGLAARRYSDGPVRFTGALGVALNFGLIAALVSNPYTGGGATLFYGATMLIAAWRGQAGCEATVISNLALDRDDQIGCPTLTPIDAAESHLRARRAEGGCEQRSDQSSDGGGDAMTMTSSIVSMAGVTRRFAGVTAVEDLSLELRAGETAALLGPNGAGKTTALEVMLGLQRPDTGRVSVFGGSSGDAIASGRVGAMLQEGDLPPGAKVAELVDLVRGLYPRPLPLADALRLGDVAAIADRRVERLSGGQRQRVRLAVALAGRPELLVLDEPTAAMDVATRRSFWSAAGEHVSGGRSLLFSTHRLEEAEEVADRVLVMASGRIVAGGAPEDVKAMASGRGAVSFRANGIPIETLQHLPAVEEVELARGRVTMRTGDPERTVRALLEAAPQVEALEVAASRLEDAFLALTSEEDSR